MAQLPLPSLHLPSYMPLAPLLPFAPPAQLCSLNSLKLTLLCELCAGWWSVSCSSTRLSPGTESTARWQIRYTHAHTQTDTHTHTHTQTHTRTNTHALARPSLQDLSLLKTLSSRLPVFKPRVHILSAFRDRISNRIWKARQHISKAKAVANEQGNRYHYEWAERCQQSWLEADGRQTHDCHLRPHCMS